MNSTVKKKKTSQNKSTVDQKPRVKPAFTHFHLHTEYSMLDGLVRAKELMPRVKELGMDSVAITDHGVMYGVPPFYTAAKEYGVKPIIGMEAYLSEDHTKKSGKWKRSDDEEKLYHHLVLLAKNKQGYKNLVKLASIAATDGFYYRPRIDKKLLEQYKEGLVVTSACYGGEIPQSLMKYHKHGEKKALEEAAKIIEWYRSLFKDDYYIEIQRDTSGLDAEKVVDPLLVKLAKYAGVPLVAGTDVHYLLDTDAKIQDMLWAVKEGKLVSDPTHKKMPTEGLYLKSPQEMLELFKDVPEAAKTTAEIAEKIEEYEILDNAAQPEFLDLKKGEKVKGRLKQEAFKGLDGRYPEVTKEMKERANYELNIIDSKGFNDYFLVVADFVNWAKDQGILVGPGRGSGAGSIVAYSLGITNVDPLIFGLTFERFLNPERPSAPDFDIDFQDDKRHEVIEYVRQKYGQDKLAAILTVGRMKTKLAIRDFCRVLDIPLDIADKIAKLIPVKRGKPMPIQDAMKEVPELKELINTPELRQMAKAVDRVHGMARHISLHPCGYLITPKPVDDYVPLHRAPKGENEVIAQYEGKYLEKNNWTKLDFLGLRNLTIIKNSLRAIEKNHDIKIDIENIPLDDKTTYKLFQLALTDAVFQLESGGMKNYLRELQPETIYDIDFMVACYRPGPMEYIPKYIACKKGEQEPEYLHPNLEPILKETYGYAVYQEQVLKIAVEIAGYTLGGADILRRAIGKKDAEILAKEKKPFIEGVVKQGYTKELGEKLFAYMEPFADYGFNRAHSSSYALIAYQTAYLKAHHPVEFMTGLLQTDLGKPERLEKAVDQAVAMGIEILPPDINESSYYFTIVEHNDQVEKKWMDIATKKDLSQERLGAIRFGLGGIKSSSGKAMKHIISTREEHGEFKHLDDLLNALDLNLVDKKTLLHLAMVGAMDKWGDRAALIELIPGLYERYKTAQTKRAEGQKSLFDNLGGDSDQKTKELIAQTALPEVDPVQITDQIKWEKDLLSIVLSEHPLEKIGPFLAKKKALSIDTIRKSFKSHDSKKPLVLAAQINRIKRINTKNDEPMAFVDLYDIGDTLSGVIFPRDFKKLAKKLGEVETDVPLLIKGRYSLRNDRESFIISGFTDIDIDKALKVKGPLPEKPAETIVGKEGWPESSQAVNNLGTDSTIVFTIHNSQSKKKLEKFKEFISKLPQGSKQIVVELNNGQGVNQTIKIKKRVEVSDLVVDRVRNWLES